MTTMSANTSTTGSASHGDSQAITATKSSVKGRSISAVTVPEAMKSRTCSKPRSWLAKAPTDSGR